MAPTPSTRATRSRFSSPMQSLGASGTPVTESKPNGSAKGKSKSTAKGNGNASSNGNSNSNSSANASTPGSGSTSRPNAGGSSSRPTATSNGHSGTGATNAQKALMARWLEPPVQNRPSFEEAGFQRHGVFDGMAPLGSLPKPTILAKRLQNLPEEKLYSSINSDASPSPNPAGRQSAKQKQKELKEKEKNAKRKSKSQPEEEDDDEGLDGPEAQQEQWRLEEEREQHIREAAEAAEAAEATEAAVAAAAAKAIERQRQRDKEEQEKLDRERERLEDEERQRLQEEQPTPSKKIILKRPSGSRKPPTRIIVNTRRAQQAAEAAEEAVDEADEGDAEEAVEAADKTTSHKRKTIIVSPKAKAAKAKAAEAAKKAQEAKEEEDKAKEAQEPVSSRETSPKTTKRPVGRPRSRRSIAAENRMLKKQEQEKAEAQAEAEAEAAKQADAKKSPTPTARVQVEAKVESVESVEPEPTEPTQPSKVDGADRVIEDSEDDADNGNHADNEADSDNDNDNEAGISNGRGLVMDSSILPLIPLNSASEAHRAHSDDSNATMVNKEVTDHVVTIAIAEALRHGRYPTAWALRTLYDENSGNQKFLIMVEDVFQQTADEETVKAFVRLVHNKKKQGRKGKRGWRYFLPADMIVTDDCIPDRPALEAPYADLLELDFATLLDPKKAGMWAMQREARRQQQLEESSADPMALDDDDDVFRSKPVGTSADPHAQAHAEASTSSSPRKRLKLSSTESVGQRRESVSFSMASPLTSSASPAPAGRGSHGPPISTFAAPASATAAAPPTAIFTKPRAYSHAKTASIDEQLPPIRASSSKTSPAKATKSAAPPKTPTKGTGRGPGRPLGSTKAKAEAKAAAVAAAAAGTAAASTTLAKSPVAAPASSRRRPHARTTSIASSTSSLSSAISLSPPGKTPQTKKTSIGSTHNIDEMAVDDYSESSDDGANDVDDVNDADDEENVVTHDSAGGMKTSVGWTFGTLQKAAREKKAKEEKEREKEKEKEEQQKLKKLKRERKASRKAQDNSTPNNKTVGERPRSGPGSGRGGRRRGAGRPPKNRGNSHSVSAGETDRSSRGRGGRLSFNSGSGFGSGSGSEAGAGADAATPSKAALVNVVPAPTASSASSASSAPSAPTTSALAAPGPQPIADRNRAAAKKSPTPSALISPSTSSAQSHSQSDSHSQNPHSHPSHPSRSSHPHNITDKSTSQPQPPSRSVSQSKESRDSKEATPAPSRSQPKRSSATAAAAAISASAKVAEKARESQDSQDKLARGAKGAKGARGAIEGAADMPSAVQEHASVRSAPASKRARASLPPPAPAASTPASARGGDDNGDAAAKAAADVQRQAQMRREARLKTNMLSNAPESYTRGEDASAPSPKKSSAAAAAISTPRQRQLRASTTTVRTTRSSRKRAFDEVEDDASPRSASFQPDEAAAAATPVSASTRLQTPVPGQQSGAASGAAAGAANASRASTPGPKAKKARVGPRVKTSPVKKKTGAFAGTPRLGGERGSPVGNIPLNQDDNDDYCASCGGNGDLVCCDGCTLSFHFQCVDPPVHEGRDLPDEWFCNNCISRHNPAALTRYSGLFGMLLNNMEKKNSRAFRLPAETRDYFEGVKTGPDGEYEAVVAPGTNRTRKRAGYDEMFDFFRLRDFDNNLALCHGCNCSAENPNKKNESGRPIIPCAYCSLWWHIDCLDPPLAQPPPIRNWRCPAHADDVLGLLPQKGTAHRFRKVKNAPVVKTAYSRGMVNNGYIEFASDSESDTTPNNSGWKDPAMFGRLQRVSAKSVQLDFMEFVATERAAVKGKGKQRRDRLRLKQERPEYRAQNDAASHHEKVATTTSQLPSVPPPTQPIKSDLLPDRQFIDKAQAAHGLAALSSGVDRTDRTGDLINALLQNADPTVVSLMAQSSAVNIEKGAAALKSDDLIALQAMRAQIDQLLSSYTAAAPKSTASSPEPHHAEITMDDAPASPPHGEAESNESNEANEEMSLVTDNGDSDMNEDEEPPAIATPSAAVAVAGEPTAACEGVAESDWAPTAISTLGKGDVDVNASFPHQHHLPPVHIDAPKPDQHESAAAAVEATTLPSPLTPPATSDMAADDDEVNDANDANAVADAKATPAQAASTQAETIDEEVL